MSAFQWTALAFALIWITWKILDRGAESVAILLQRFRHDGNRSVSAPDSNSPLVDVPSVSVGHPFAVDASNGSLTKTEREDIRRLGGLVEFHRVPEGIVPPKSRPMRRTIH